MDNKQCMGYMLLACKKEGFSKDEARKLLLSMNYLFDIKTVEEAEIEGHDWYYNLD